MIDADPDKTYINGPINVVRLEGKIDGVQKVLSNNSPIGTTVEKDNTSKSDSIL